jgi:hypothetical protein
MRLGELGIIGERFERAAEAQRRAPMIPIYRLKLWVSLVGAAAGHTLSSGLTIETNTGGTLSKRK